jgi:preprotein translocase subunit Sec61beta
VAEEKKTYMPATTAGLIRYMDVEKEEIRLKPEHVVLISIIFSLFVIFAKLVL